MKRMMDARFMHSCVEVRDVVEKLATAEVVQFTSMQPGDAEKHYGIKGQSIEESFPHAVVKDGLGHYYVSMEEVVPLLVRAVAELSARVHELEAKRKPKAASAGKPAATAEAATAE